MDIKEKINLKRLNSILRKNKLTITILILIFVIGGCLYSFNFVVPKYKSTSTVLLVSKETNKKNSSVTQSDVTLNKSLLTTYGNIITSNNVLNKVIENLQLSTTADELSKNINIEEIEDTQMIKINVIDRDASQAQRICKEINNVFINEIKTIYNIENVTIVDEASLEENPYNINHVRDVIIALVAGITISGMFVFITYALDTSIKIEQDIEDFVGLKVIGTVPKSKEKIELIVNENSKSAIAESLKSIRTNIEFIQNKKTSKSILITSCNSGEGKSWIASNMAIAYAQANKNVIIIDSDMRKGRQHLIFNVDNKLGLSNCLNQIQENEDDYKIIGKYIKETGISKVHIMTIGAIPPNPSELLLSKKMEYLIKMLKNIYDIVIIDGTPCNLVSDSIPVSRITDSTVIVTESKKTKIEDLKNVKNQINNAKGTIIGTILNKKEIKRREYSKGYYGNIENNKIIEVKRTTVKELIENRKENAEEDIKTISENDTKLELLGKRIEELEDLLLEIPDLTINNYEKIVKEVKQVYKKEVDKEVLAEKIKNDSVKKEIIEELRKNTGIAEENINKKLQELSENDNIEKIINRINGIEQLIKNNDNQDNIVKKIEEMKDEQDEKIKMLDSSKVLNNLVVEMQKLNSKYKNINNIEQLIKNNNSKDIIIEKLDKSSELNDIIEQIKKLNEKYENIEKLENKIISDKNEDLIIEKLKEIQKEQNSKIEELDKSNELNNIIRQIEELNEKYKNIEKLENKISSNKTEDLILEKMKELQIEQNSKIERLDSSKALNNIVIQMQKLNRKYEDIQNIEELINNDEIEIRLNERLNELQEEQDRRIRQLDNTRELNNIIIEMQDLNRKYNKVQSLEKAITNDKTEERINKMIEKMKKDNEKKLEKIDNTAAIKEIMKELKKINVKYDKMAEKIAKNNTNTRNTTSNKTKPKKDNIIEITELKDKLNKQELVIEFGKEIEYEQLLNTAIDTYEIKPNKKSKKA